MRSRLPSSVFLLLTTQLFVHTSLATPAWTRSAGGADRPLTFEERVDAQRAIERVYNSHRLFARPLDEVMPQALLERKVRAYLKQSAALRIFWQAPITSEALDDEIRRVMAGTRIPERLVEVFAALGNDPRLIRECLARPLLADRLARQMFAEDPPHGEPSWEAFWRKVEPTLPEETPTDGEAVQVSIPSAAPQFLPAPCPPDDTWTPTALPQGTIPGFQSSVAIWTGSEMLAFRPQGPASEGGVYDPTTDSWTHLPVAQYSGIPNGSKAVWTGTEVIFWGGYKPLSTNQPTSYPRYNPFTQTWGTGIPTGLNLWTGLFDHSVVWTGTELIAWGGTYYQCSCGPDQQLQYVGPAMGGSRFNPLTGGLTTIAATGQPLRAGHSAVWTGSRMVVFGGYRAVLRFTDPLSWYQLTNSDGGSAFDPQTGSWAPLSAAGQPSPRHNHSAVWTGDSMIVWGGQFTANIPPGSLTTTILGDGGIYDPTTDSWSAIPVTAGSPTAREKHTAVWTGLEMIIWNGPSDRARYDPDTSVWTTIATDGAPCMANFTSAFWTGQALLAWGCPDYSGGQYLLYQHDDRDLDGLSFCEGDCDDANAAVHPGAVETCNLLDDDCDGTLLAGEADADSDGYRGCDLDCDDANAASWPGAPEICDGLDNDCDGGLPPWEGQPGAQELCDGRDNNCNGASDEGFPDSDNDGRADCVDCRPADPNTWAAPPEVTNVQAVLQDGVQYFLWDDLYFASGSSVVYDVFSGSLNALRQGAGDFSSGSCLYADLFNYACEVTAETPAVGDGLYLMVRGRNTCGTGTYGSSHSDQTAGASPLACP